MELATAGGLTLSLAGSSASVAATYLNAKPNFLPDLRKEAGEAEAELGQRRELKSPPNEFAIADGLQKVQATLEEQDKKRDPREVP